jgi:hypothetical protein
MTHALCLQAGRKLKRNRLLPNIWILRSFINSLKPADEEALAQRPVPMQQRQEIQTLLPEAG